jgi:hypothetical protein
MENHILLRPLPLPMSYVRHFQVAQRNFTLYIEEERQKKKKQRKYTSA